MSDAPPLHEWHCFQGNTRNLTCRLNHHYRTDPDWEGPISLQSHERCGWIEVPEEGDKTLFPQRVT